jgi:hypothetical protein
MPRPENNKKKVNKALWELNRARKKVGKRCNQRASQGNQKASMHSLTGITMSSLDTQWGFSDTTPVEQGRW